MNAISPDMLIAIIAIAAVVVVAVFLIARSQRTNRLRRKFGQEYDRTVAKHHNRAKAETELLRREERVARLKIVPLTQQDVHSFSLTWDDLQSHFVDNPKGAVLEADRLVREVMLKRGFPMSEFEPLAADISLRYPAVVSNYQAAREAAARAGEATDTEALRQAVVHYRTLFDELLGVTPAPRTMPKASHIPVHS